MKESVGKRLGGLVLKQQPAPRPGPAASSFAVAAMLLVGVYLATAWAPLLIPLPWCVALSVAGFAGFRIELPSRALGLGFWFVWLTWLSWTVTLWASTIVVIADVSSSQWLLVVYASLVTLLSALYARSVRAH